MVGRYSNAAKERFWQKVRKTKTCWFWKGANTVRAISGAGRTKMTPKRLAYILVKGTIPQGAPLICTCDTPGCINPKHQVPYRKRSRLRICANCGKKVRKGFAQINRSISGRVFCGRSCSASYNNQGKQRFKTKDWPELSRNSSLKKKWVSEGRSLICTSCGFNGDKKPWCMEIDHILPVHLGGETSPDNLQPLCLNCHMDKTVAEHRARMKHTRV